MGVARPPPVTMGGMVLDEALIVFHTLHEKCPNTQFFLVCIFLYSDCTEIYSINLCIQSEYKKIRTRKNSVFGHFSRSDKLQ